MIDQNSYYLFPTVVSTFNIFSDVSNVMDIVESIKTESKGYNGLIAKGERSESSRFLEKHPELKSIIQNCIDNYTEELGLIKNKISYSWCNHYSKEGTIKPHRHELSVVSGAYYPFVDGYGGQLVFDNPCSIFKINEVTKDFNEYNRQDFRFDIFPGLLILFPSWLTHYTENNQAENRFVISFDTTINSQE
jgi:uncharacterized protein (TIGR02466 family)